MRQRRIEKQVLIIRHGLNGEESKELDETAKIIGLTNSPEKLNKIINYRR